MIEALEPYVHTVCFFDPQGQAKRLLELFRRRTGALPYPDKLGRVVMLQSVARITEHRTKRKISKAAPRNYAPARREQKVKRVVPRLVCTKHGQSAHLALSAS